MRALSFLLAIVGFSSAASFAWAGRNANGALIVHTDDTYNYSAGTVCSATQGDPGRCELANTTATRETGQVVWLLATWCEGAIPGVTVIYFGIDYDATTLDPGFANKYCGPPGSLEIPDPDWPYSGRGNSVAFGNPVVGDTMFPFYAFKIDGGVAGQSFFCTTVNPTGGYAAFVDDSNPPVLDLVHAFGCIRWGEPGANDCQPCPEAGACCYRDGTCQLQPEPDCAAAGGVYQGDVTDCDPNPCPPPGACCFHGGCVILPYVDCVAYGGEWNGAPSCHPNPCPQPQGACCFEDGTCRQLTEDGCSEEGGTYLGDETDCAVDPCSEWGACCAPDGSCTFAPESACADAGGQFQGALVPCDPNPCPPAPGACCFEDGSCEVLPPEACEEQDGQFYSGSCDPPPCPQAPLGACCDPATGGCTVTTVESCAGNWQGLGTDCDPNPCPPPVPAQRTTWGRIKATYR